ERAAAGAPLRRQPAGLQRADLRRHLRPHGRPRAGLRRGRCPGRDPEPGLRDLPRCRAARLGGLGLRAQGAVPGGSGVPERCHLPGQRAEPGGGAAGVATALRHRRAAAPRHPDRDRRRRLPRPADLRRLRRLVGGPAAERDRPGPVAPGRGPLRRRLRPPAAEPVARGAAPPARGDGVLLDLGGGPRAQL
ncbi:MAG: UPF0301 protein YqgE, partial [uncultured Friedmanniella sp.]